MVTTGAGATTTSVVRPENARPEGRPVSNKEKDGLEDVDIDVNGPYTTEEDEQRTDASSNKCRPSSVTLEELAEAQQREYFS